MAFGRSLVHNRRMSKAEGNRESTERSTLLPPPSDDAYDYLELVVTRAMRAIAPTLSEDEVASLNDVPTLPAFEVALF